MPRTILFLIMGLLSVIFQQCDLNTLFPPDSPPPAPTAIPTAQPTLAPTASPVVPPTTAPTIRPTNTTRPTLAPTDTSTPTATATPTNTATPTVTSTSTITPTLAPTNTPTPSPTLTPASAPTATVTATGTITPTLTPAPAVATPIAAQPGQIVLTGNTAVVQITAPGGAIVPSQPVTGTLGFNPASNPNCRDGEVLGVQQNTLRRVPIGLGENNTILQLSWVGEGFGGFDRVVIVTPVLSTTHQVFFLAGETAVMTRHCGDVTAVVNYAAQPGSYIQAMRQTAADGLGYMPPPEEIGVYLIDLGGNLLEVVKPTAANAPSITEVADHIQIVLLQP